MKATAETKIPVLLTFAQSAEELGVPIGAVELAVEAGLCAVVRLSKNIVRVARKDLPELREAVHNVPQADVEEREQRAVDAEARATARREVALQDVPPWAREIAEGEVGLPRSKTAGPGHTYSAGLASSPLPKSLLSLDEAEKMFRVTSARLREFCDAGYAPHYRIDGEPLFHKATLRAWIANELMCEVEGRSYPGEIVFTEIRPGVNENARPYELLGVENLQTVGRHPFPPCVYFLVRSGKVVYVGQSVSLGQRLSSHSRDKDFDAVYFVPVPSSALHEVEGNFIRRLRPEYNQTHGANRRGHDDLMDDDGGDGTS